MNDDLPTLHERHSALEVLLVFLRLGCTSFGGPVAHMGYFRREFVERRRWLTEQTYAELIAIAHSLPGPGSSQVGFSVGLLRAGWMGGLAAWFGFTLPSAVLMIAIARGQSLWASPAGERVSHGLQLVAVAVVAQAVVAMQRSLAPDLPRLAFAAVAAAAMLFLSGSFLTLTVIVVAAAAGLVVFRERTVAQPPMVPLSISPQAAIGAAVGFAGLLVFSLLAANAERPLVAGFAAFYRSGALVFGGGHVVLPLLQHAVVDRGWVSQPVFLTGYGAAQAMPGPLFSFGAYLGAAMAPDHWWISASVCLAGIFLPGLLAMAAVLPFWGRVREDLRLRAALVGVNASVVGILLAALIHPLWTSAVRGWQDLVVAVAAFVLLQFVRVQPWMVVVGVAGLSVWMWL